MSNLDTDTTAGEDIAGAATPSTLVEFALKNGAGNITVDTARLPDDVYREALMQGLKVIAERAMSKITKESYPVEADRKAAIHAKAEANIQDMYDGKTKITGAKSVKKASGAVMTEAMRVARNLIKDAMKVAKVKISTVKASEITKAAKAFLETPRGAEVLAQAEKTIEDRAKTPVVDSILSLIKVDPDLVRKDEEKKAKAKEGKPLSAKQAGRVAPRAKVTKPGSQANA